MTRVLTAMCLVLLTPAAAAAQGSLTGCVTDVHRQAMPGVEVVVSGEGTRQRAVTDASGCYRFVGLPDGSYSVKAAIPGFVTGWREGTAVADGRTAGPVNFALCLAALDEIDWIVPRGLQEMWTQADIVAHVRISATAPVASNCPTNDVEHTAAVLKLLKGSAGRDPAGSLAFVQQIWSGERTPYRVGQEMIVFLAASGTGFARLAGPYSVFVVEGGKVVSAHTGVRTEGASVGEFLARISALDKH